MELMTTRTNQLNTSGHNLNSSKIELHHGDGRQESLFSKRQALRKIKVLIDADLLSSIEIQDSTKKSITPETVLEALINHALVELYKYSDSGPSSDVAPIEFINSFKPPHPTYMGWVVVHALKNNFRIVTIGNSREEYQEAIVWNEMPQLARNYADNAKANTFSPEVRERDVLAAHVAGDALQADLYITERSFLYSGSKLASVSGLTICTPQEAITIIALYLRTQGEFLLPSPIFPKHALDKGLYFWIGTRELLPESWRWRNGCSQYSISAQDDSLLLLSGFVLSRVARALQERDIVHIALNQPPNNNTIEEALDALDNVLTLLMGAVDASARVAKRVVGSPVEDKYVSWQNVNNSNWLSDAPVKAPKLIKLFESSRHGLNALMVLRLFRNNLHGIGLQGVEYSQDGKSEVLISVPYNDNDEVNILLAMDALGGTASWGVRPILQKRFRKQFRKGLYIDPGIFVDKLFEEIIKLLNDLMKETPVELLPNVKILPKDKVPFLDKPGAGIYNTFSEWNRHTIRMHLGF